MYLHVTEGDASKIKIRDPAQTFLFRPARLAESIPRISYTHRNPVKRLGGVSASVIVVNRFSFRFHYF